MAPDPSRELDDSRKAAVWAKRGFIAYFAGRVVGFLVSIVVLNSFIDEIRRAIDTDGTYQPKNSGIQLLSTPASVVSILGLVAVMIWLTKAVKVAYNLHYPRVHAPVWAVLGWIVPVVNFWFPYQVVRDCLPPWSEQRRLVAYWWTAYIVGFVLWIPAIVVSIFADYGIAVAAALPATLAACFELHYALQVVDVIVDDHTEAVARLRR
jgi:hypothetical protein